MRKTKTDWSLDDVADWLSQKPGSNRCKIQFVAGGFEVALTQNVRGVAREHFGLSRDINRALSWAFDSLNNSSNGEVA